jgi:hypothetical protein
MPNKDLQKEEIIKKYNLDGAKSNWKVSPSKFTTLVSNLPTNFKLLTEFMLGKNKPININDFTKDELVSIITLAEKQKENKLNVKNRKLKGQPENITTVSGYDLKGRTKTFPDWVENNPYFTAMANSLSSPDYQVRTSLGKYDVEETPSSLIVKDAYDMNIKQRDLPKIGDRKNLSKILDYMRVDPEMAGEFISNIIRPNQNDSRKFDLVIPKRKPDQPSPKDTAYQAPMQLKEKPKDNPRVKEKVPEGFDILKFDEGGDVAAQTDNLFGYTDEAVTKEVDKYKENVNTELSFKDAATFVAEATPIIGDALAAKEVYDELQKNDPNYLLIGVLGGAALVGLIPGLGDAAASAIKTGAKKALDTAKRIEVDPSTLGSMGGNINLTPKAANSPDEPKIISFTKKKEDKELKDFNANLMSSISEQASKQAELVGELQEAGVYGDYQKGVRVQSQNYKGEALPPYTITGLSLNKVKLNSPNLKRTEDRLGIKFEYIEKDGDYYLPMLSVEQADGGKSQVYLDALKQRNTPIMDGPKDFNKGGAVMNEQMEMAFMQQGGLKDDGMKRDPVSGNEVPSGSMAKEVRDDISANLSEGEYVVPADVVRFFGVKFFEDLRTEAKIGLQTMEANGRIGGEPVDEPMQDEGEMSDEEFEQLIRQELGSMQMAEGGMVPEVNQEMGTPAPIKAAEGTLVPTRRFNPFRYAGLGSTLTPGYLPPAPPTEELPAVDTEESCAARGMVLGPNGVCIMPIAEQVTSRGTDDDPAIPVETAEAKPWYEDDSTLFTDPSSYIEAQLGRGEMFDNPLMRAGALMAGPLGLVAGAANKIGDIEGIARSRAALEVARATGSLPAEEIERLQKLIDRDVQGNLLVDQDGKGFGIATGLNYLKEFSKQLGFDSWEEAKGSNMLKAYNSAQKEKAKPSDAGLSRAAQLLEKRKKEGPTEKQKEASARVKRALEGSKSVEEIAKTSKPPRDDDGPSAAEIAASRASAQRAADRLGTGLATGGRATGGLVSKPKKKK